MFLKVLFITISLENGSGCTSALSCSAFRGFGDPALGAGGLRRGREPARINNPCATPMFRQKPAYIFSTSPC
jgi:hypothetical protein